MVLLLEGAWQAAEGGGRPVDCAAGKYLAQGECGWLPHLMIGASGVWRGRASGTYGHLLLRPPALRRPRRCGAPWGPRLEGSWRAGPLNPQAASPLSCRALSSRARAGCAGGRGRGREGQGPRRGADGSPRPLPRSFTQAMLSQPQMESLGGPTGYRLGLALLGVGSVFVLSSFLALGFTGTFLGDYFGILMEARVTRFPFSVLDNPMYWGSTAVYLGWALMHASPTGLLLTLVVAAIYKLAILFEEPFTAEIYRQRGSQARKRS